MPIPLPNLDDRRWTDLVDEGRALVPRYAPGWTDHNVHDPGVTLMELFAWLTETAIYRLNRIPARHRRKFLELIGFAPYPPRPAKYVLGFHPELDTLPGLLPAGVRLGVMNPSGEKVSLRTVRDAAVLPVKISSISLGSIDDLSFAQKHYLNEELPLALFGHDPQPGATFRLWFDLDAYVLETQTVSHPFTVYFCFQSPHSGEAERKRIFAETERQQTACLPVLPDIQCNGSAPAPSQKELPPHHSVRVVWEVRYGAGEWIKLKPVPFPRRPAPGEVMDDTRSLTLDGAVELHLPLSLSGQFGGEVRCRLVEGAYDSPPILTDLIPNGVLAEQSTPIWQTFGIAPEARVTGTPPTGGDLAGLRFALDEQDVIQELTFEDIDPKLAVLAYQPPEGANAGQISLPVSLIGRGTGYPGQTALLPQAPVAHAEIQLHTLDQTGWQRWTQRNDLDPSRRDDHHFVLDATHGEVFFGDGEPGCPPSAGSIMLAAYAATIAERGNGLTGKTMQLLDTPINTRLLANVPLDLREQLGQIAGVQWQAVEGREQESLGHATGRAIETLHAHERLLDLCAGSDSQSLDQCDRQKVRTLQAPTRAVNLLDIERIALETPGTDIARVRAWPGYHPDYPCLHASGVVTVVVVPDMPVDKPLASPGLLDAVKRYLDGRRMITTRIEVAPARYLQVQVEATVRTFAFVDIAQVRRDIDAALNEFLDTRAGGPDRRGWPFGRDVYRSEILQTIDSVTGVDHVLALRMVGDGLAPQCGNLSLCPTWLVAPGEHQIEVVRGTA